MANDKKKKFKHVSRKGTLYQAKQIFADKSIIDRKEGPIAHKSKASRPQSDRHGETLREFCVLTGFWLFFS